MFRRGSCSGWNCRLTAGPHTYWVILSMICLFLRLREETSVPGKNICKCRKNKQTKAGKKKSMLQEMNLWSSCYEVTLFTTAPVRHLPTKTSKLSMDKGRAHHRQVVTWWCKIICGTGVKGALLSICFRSFTLTNQSRWQASGVCICSIFFLFLATFAPCLLCGPG